MDPEGMVEIYSGDTKLGDEILTLDAGSQRFTGEVQAAAVGVGCSDASAHDFWFTVMDADGNESEAKVVAGEAE